MLKGVIEQYFVFIEKRGALVMNWSRYLIFFFILYANLKADPLLVVVLMVKNEAPVICQTLDPYVQAGIDSYLIFDTGSTDNTVQLARSFFKKNGINNVIIHQEPFVDFATSRNRALELAQEHFSDANFLIMPDAEWRIENAQGLLKFCSQHKCDKTQAYWIRMIRDNVYDYYTARLMRARTGCRFVGVVHEVLDVDAKEKVPRDIYFNWHRSAYGLEKSRERWLRDISLLLKAHEQNPDDPRTVFYIAQTYACLDDWNKAKEWYGRRVSMQGWDEENFVAQYRLAQVYERLGEWSNALETYLNAHSSRPSRAEPLISLAQHYWDCNEYSLCYLFARRAVELPYPKDDILFIEKELYDFTRYDLLGRAAWYVQDYNLGESAIRKAISLYPNKSYLQENLKYYAQRQQ